ncbi:sugar phosphate nucleotidyltransferase [Chloracidobacterium aggregatum]|uniref:sugar phosphate nucleotidyltransferase n=1 Tax=Chloracidobacterium aggregatum TaxID=2851959 RepID=UPI001B8C8E5A|nr:sugar phosphate nucleotidyltransferase [Chloracidobacterium aggregatum]QUV91829.1 NTP transferase domain-containing protein [Chloracidobacterium sp. A]
MQTLILAGGKGTRLRPLTLHTPKPVVPIANRPFIYYQLDLLRPLDVTGTMEVLLSLSYQPRKIEEVLNQEVLGGWSSRRWWSTSRWEPPAPCAISGRG